MLNLQTMCTHVMRLIHAVVRVYDSDGRQTLRSTDENTADPLVSDIEFESALLKRGSSEAPIFVTDGELSHYTVIKTAAGETIIIGPYCYSENARAAAAETVKLHHMDRQTPFYMSNVAPETLYEAVLMLFHFVSESTLSRNEMLLKNFSVEEIESSVEKKAMNVFTDYRENNKQHNPYSQEQREQEAIRTGDIEALKRSIEEVYEGELGKMAVSSLRSAKNIAIAVLTLASRSAIAGGVLPEVAFSLSDAYSMKIEEMRTEPEVEVVLRTAEYHYANLVQEHLNSSKNNPVIMSCKDYVIKHINRKIALNDIADALKMNASYLSDLFSKQEGMTLSEYISAQKIAHAKRRLIYTDDTYGQIAYDFAFSSQSHFGKVFKKLVGMTPKEFREKNKSHEV